MIPGPPYHEHYDEDTDKWLVLNQFDKYEAGPMTHEEAIEWIKRVVEDDETS